MKALYFFALGCMLWAGQAAAQADFTISSHTLVTIAPGTTVSAHGNFVLYSGILNNRGTLAFKGNAVNMDSITARTGTFVYFGGNGQVVIPLAYKKLVMQGSGTKEVSGPLAVGDSLLMQGGFFKANAPYAVVLDSTAWLVETPASRVINRMETSKWVAGSSPAWPAGGMGIALTPTANALGYTTLARETGPMGIQMANGHQSIARTFEVVPAVATESYDLQFQYRDDELNGQNEATLRAYRKPLASAGWQLLAAMPDTGLNEQVAAAQMGAYRYTFADSAQALPIVLLSFTAKLVGETGMLNWATSQELGCRGFDVLRSTNGTTWASTFTASEGANTLSVRVTDAAGNQRTQSLAFTLDTTAARSTRWVSSVDGVASACASSSSLSVTSAILRLLRCMLSSTDASSGSSCPRRCAYWICVSSTAIGVRS